VVEGARLESVYTGNRIEGSNPSPSANCSSVFVAPSPQANLMCDMADTVRVKQLSARSTCTKMHSINLIELKFTTYNLVTFG
jgi:hypothetical protein